MPKPSKKQSKSASKIKDRDQWIVIAPEAALGCSEGCPDPVFVKLKHPKTDKGAMFFFSSDGGSVHEVMRFKRDFGSWFINDSVQQDGSLEMVTLCDPIFLALPYLVKSSQQRNKFMTLDQIIHDEEYPQCIRLLHCTGMSAIDRVAEVKGSGDVRAYRYDESKTLGWLKDKVEQTASCLATTDVHVACGAQSTTFVRSNRDHLASEEDYQRYAAGLVADYLNPDLGKQLYEHLGMKEISEKVAKVVENVVTEPPTKKARISSDKSEPDEDYSKAFARSENNNKDDRKPAKMSATQKALSKVDKTGMKSISSFFTKKPKK